MSAKKCQNKRLLVFWAPGKQSTMRKCWFVMHSAVIISFSCCEFGEEFPNMMLMILCVVGVDVFDLVGD